MRHQCHMSNICDHETSLRIACHHMITDRFAKQTNIGNHSKKELNKLEKLLFLTFKYETGSNHSNGTVISGFN